MARFRFAAALLLVAVGGMASAADSPLTAFSDEADVVIRIKAPKTTVDKAASLVDAIQPGFGPMVRQNAAAMGVLISNPTLAGVDQTKDWYIGIYTNGKDEPSVVFGVPVTDAAAAKAAVGEGMKSKDFGSWLYYSDDEDAVPKKAVEDGNIEAAMKGEPAGVFDRGDVAVFVNLAHLMTEYKDQLTEGVTEVKEAITRIPPQPGADPAVMQKMYGDMLDTVIQGLKDSVQLTVALNVGADGISVEDYIGFTPKSGISNFLSSQTTSAMDLAAKMPSDAVMIFGASGDVKKMIDWGMTMSKAMVADQKDTAKALDEFTSAASKLKFGSIVGSMTLTKGDAGLFKTVAVTEVSPAQTYKDLSRKMVAAMGTVEKNGLKQETKLEKDAETYGSSKADVLTVKQDFDASADPTGMAKQMQTLMFGPDGMQARVVYQQDRFIQTMGGGKESMTEALKALDNSTPSAAVGTYRKGLIPSANVLFLIDVPGLAVQGLRVASAIPGVPLQIQPEMLDSLKFERSFMGFTAAVEKDAVRAKTRIPVEQLRSLFGLVMFAQQMQAQRN